jgi:hypothetical protein
MKLQDSFQLMVMKQPNIQSAYDQSVQNYRSRTFRILPGSRLKTQDEAVRFVEERGFVYFWPIKGIDLPSLWAAVAGNRPVADEHDDAGHVTWRWKDNLLGSKKWYYGKVLRKKATIISNQILPFFYALSNNFGSPEEDHLILYEQGKLSIEEKSVYDALLREGPLDTITLKRSAHLSSTQNGSRFDRAITNLQSDFKIMPIGVADAGSWHYAFIYDIVTHYLPDILEKTAFISEDKARETILRSYFLSVGGANTGEVIKLFHWRSDETRKTLDILIESKFLTQIDSDKFDKDDRFILSSMIN